MSAVQRSVMPEKDVGNVVPTASLVAARAADAKQGADTVLLAMGELLVLTDAFVVTSGRNPRQVRSIVEEVERAVKVETGRSPVRLEGLDDLTWVLMDYGDFLVHVFLEETRAFYDIERLWGNALRVPWGDAAALPADGGTPEAVAGD
jgi:ribosome-associated protein